MKKRNKHKPIRKKKVYGKRVCKPRRQYVFRNKGVRNYYEMIDLDLVVGLFERSFQELHEKELSEQLEKVTYHVAPGIEKGIHYFFSGEQLEDIPEKGIVNTVAIVTYLELYRTLVRR